MPLNTHCGYMHQSIWDNIKKTSVEFFEKPKAYRRIAVQGEAGQRHFDKL